MPRLVLRNGKVTLQTVILLLPFLFLRFAVRRNALVLAPALLVWQMPW